MNNRLAPVSEEPIDDEDNSRSTSTNCNNKKKKAAAHTWKHWLTNHFPLLFHKKSDLKVLLSVLGCPLFPLSVHHHPKHPISQVSSSAQYIIAHFTAATGCRKLEGVVKNMYATGKVAMAIVDDHSSNGSTAGPNAGLPQKGCFVIWQMVPNKWSIELVVGGHKVVAGSDGNVAWRHTPWLSAHAAKGGVRPLRRALQAPNSQNEKINVITLSLQGLDPVAISLVFSTAQYMGEKHISGVDCFVLKLSAEHADLAERSDSTAEMIKHVTLGYFSQRSGLLVYLEDSFLTRIQAPGSLPTYWETTMCTKIEDYRAVDGMMIAHSGQSSVIITRFGDNLRAGPGITRMEETYVIDDLAYNVPGLSIDTFIPPQELQKDYPEESSSINIEDREIQNLEKLFIASMAAAHTTTNTLPLKDRVAIVTGASRGIGRAIAIHLRSLGAKLVINYASSSTQADLLASDLNSNAADAVQHPSSPIAIAVNADVSNPDDVKALFDRAQQEFNTPVHILVNCAGVLDPKYPSLANTTVDDWETTFNVNTKGAFLSCREAANRLLRGGGGRIILISTSIVGASLPGYAAYAASKAAVETMAKIVAKELKGSGITVNCVAPGPVATELFYAGKSEEMVQRIVDSCPLGRLGQPNDVAQIIGFLASDAGEWVNGQVIRVNGGFVV
ncbi:hypothetical protein BUALT_Bualt12G0001600 [Buddleja alternifolia]|uniref:Ketoreductase domain-containing protein n=1 Tax=Buddleja alternifolia TaxID=168488 RepID=A0AAV6WVX5_9LAMI|nr:hypothetical protein BUALT_Bualt12G0001600 [Buddleja alternifolia]